MAEFTLQGEVSRCSLLFCTGVFNYCRYLRNNANLCKVAFNYAPICQTLGLFYNHVKTGTGVILQSYFNLCNVLAFCRGDTGK